MNTIISDNDRLEICQACFALNNMGVTMLEKGQFRSASKIFKAAIQAMKTLRSAEAPNAATKQKLLVLRQRLTKAASRAARKKKRCTAGIEIAAVDDDDYDSMEAAQQYGPTTSIVFPIRLRELPSTKTLQDECFLLDSHISVVFYNAGLAELLSYQQLRTRKSKDGNNKADALSKACRFLSVADSAVYNSIRQGGLESLRIIFLASLVLSNLSVTFRFQHESAKLARVEETLLLLERKRVVLERKESIVLCCPKLAAAAA